MAKERKKIMDKKREKTIKAICDSMNKSLVNKDSKGGAITYLGSNDVEHLERFSSGCSQLDDVLGGGWPLGRLHEIYGSESSGKTTLCYHAIAEFQKKCPEHDAAWIDSEYSFDPEYAERLGVEIEPIIFQQPEDGEQALDAVRGLLQRGVKLIIIDSTAALTPRAESEGEMGDQQMGLQARMLSKAMRLLAKEIGRANACVIFTNQVREKIGVMFGKKTTTPGGRAIRFYSSIRIDLQTLNQEKDGEEVVAVKVRATCVKNKTASPFRVCAFTITFGQGIDAIAGLFEAAIDAKVIEKSGSWFSCGEERLGQGKQNVLASMRDNEYVCEKIQKALDEKLAKKTKESSGTKEEEASPAKEEIQRVPVESEEVTVEDA